MKNWTPYHCKVLNLIRKPLTQTLFFEFRNRRWFQISFVFIFHTIIQGFSRILISSMHAFLPKIGTMNDDDLLLYLNTTNWPSYRLFSFTNLQPLFKRTRKRYVRTIFFGLFWSKCLIKPGGIHRHSSGVVGWVAAGDGRLWCSRRHFFIQGRLFVQ